MTAREVTWLHEHTVGELLDSSQDRMDITRKEMEQRLGVTEQTYRRWSYGRSHPSLKQAQKIANVCEVSIYRVLAAMGILTPRNVEVLEQDHDGAIPGYSASRHLRIVNPSDQAA